MEYRPDPGDSAMIGPGILIANFGGSGTGFLGAATDTVTHTTDIFRIDNWDGWFMVGCDGRNPGSFKCRVNGVNSPTVNLGALTTTGNQMVWGNDGQGYLLEAVVYDRPLEDAEYLQIENYWRLKYDNIRLGSATLTPFAEHTLPSPSAPEPAPGRRPRRNPMGGMGGISNMFARLARIPGIATDWTRNLLG